MESHQAGKLDTSGTAKAIISCFRKLGVSFDVDQIQMIRDPKQQIEMVGVPEEHLSGHAFHLYHLTSPDQTVSFEFQHNVCGRSIYTEGTVDAILFLAKMVKSKADKRIYNMIDVLREDLSTYLPQKIFMGFFGSTSNETELNCVKSWAFSDTDIGGNGNQLWVWIMVPVASVGILVGVAICLCLRVYKEGDLVDQGAQFQRNIEHEIKW
ncbi:hypothetical protein J1N35_023946 [Gossypium stocksii]|uniref:Dihydrodipicolinate reductase C-terminal domain-containing protein n=1 Tax=Gossypium stocksii TaxID=47602 RepID=A0A9D3VIY7_9ROSI|nr:hypothetical protein J1N35_023946 [Gossypium stocksii]